MHVYAVRHARRLGDAAAALAVEERRVRLVEHLHTGQADGDEERRRDRACASAGVAAESATRSRAVPCGTVGGRMAGTR